MKLVNEARSLVAPVFGALPRGEGVTVVVKCGYAFVDHGVATRLPTRAQPPLSGELAFEPASTDLARYATDFAPWKPQADVVLVGTHVPEPSRRGERAVISLSVGALRKSLAVVRVDAPHALLGFAPIAEASPSRRAALGTFDDAWLKTRWPYFPADFDWNTHQAAPVDQRVEGYLRGDERVRIEGLRPDMPLLETQLPGVRPRAFVRRNGAPASRAEEVPLALDTLWLDADAEQLVLVWRGVVLTSTRRGAELDALLVVEESLKDDPAPLAAFHEEGRWQRSERRPAQGLTSVAAATPEPDVSRGATVEPAHGTEAEEGDDAEPSEAAELAAMRQSFEDAGADPSLLAMFDGVDSFDGLLAKVATLVPPNAELPDGDQLEAESIARTRAALTDFGVDLGPLEEAQREEAANDASAATDTSGAAAGEPSRGTLGATVSPALDREAVAARVAAGDDLAGADLRGLDLSGLDLSGARLAKANLAGADLGDTNLKGADLAGANLRMVRAISACLDEVRAEATDFEGAVLDGASLVAAGLAGARFNGASLTGAALDRSELHGSDLT
ncbi:MAG: DUF2169 domain-containing protein [Deltaproteobacteria bacterium]|nr:DUF2169 domain-containing protein [Deltaproteobacteria bacterium]